MLFDIRKKPKNSKHLVISSILMASKALSWKVKSIKLKSLKSVQFYLKLQIHLTWALSMNIMQPIKISLKIFEQLNSQKMPVKNGELLVQNKKKNILFWANRTKKGIRRNSTNSGQMDFSPTKKVSRALIWFTRSQRYIDLKGNHLHQSNESFHHKKAKITIF